MRHAGAAWSRKERPPRAIMLQATAFEVDERPGTMMNRAAAGRA
jgi:hypothetical protein